MLAVRDANSERITKCFTEKNLHLNRGDEFTLVVKTNPKRKGLSSSYKTYQYKIKGNQNNWWIRRSGFWGTLSSYFGSARQDCLFLSQKMNELQQQGKLSDIGTSPKELKLYSVAGNGTCLFRTLVAFHTKNSAWFTQMSQAQLKGFVCKTEYKKKVCTAITCAIHSSLEMSGTDLSENLGSSSFHVDLSRSDTGLAIIKIMVINVPVLR
ncbi:hypothetical protein JQC92_17080 [Shewanella sp. 202IG2-18]|uniref:hypothetical protein n=1 Tax=Parashewanella hymeniacidonis TaxID=2807618 RepID=UPI0019602221|nr:hypothetical protein [Parashewanella hymeniacidonis]MBM7073726.1 hypothetical protein [Parashewanella hymeniacidonis]